LRPEDYICLNIGNASSMLVCDNQRSIENWQKVIENFVTLNLNIANHDSVMMLNNLVDSNNEG
jgi:hypothetical protein